MKVKELVKKLEQFDEEMEVKIKEEVYGYCDPPEVYYHKISEAFTDIEYDDKGEIVVIME